MTNIIELKPIGLVKTSASEDQIKHRKAISEIIVSEDLSEALEGIEEFSHVFIIFWMHEIRELAGATLKVHPQGRMDLPLIGVFATRTPNRPNPIGLTVVELLKKEGNILKVKGLDALDGTPVLDIKPFDPLDTAKNMLLPAWWKKLHKG